MLSNDMKIKSSSSNDDSFYSQNNMKFTDTIPSAPPIPENWFENSNYDTYHGRSSFYHYQPPLVIDYGSHEIRIGLSGIDATPRTTEKIRNTSGDLAQIEDMLINHMGVYNFDNYPVLVTKPSASNPVKEQELLEYLFETLQVPCVEMVHQNVLACQSVGVKNGLVVRLGNGHDQVEITPIYHGSLIDYTGNKRSSVTSTTHLPTLIAKCFLRLDPDIFTEINGQILLCGGRANEISSSDELLNDVELLLASATSSSYSEAKSTTCCDLQLKSDGDLAHLTSWTGGALWSQMDGFFQGSLLSREQFHDIGVDYACTRFFV